MKNPHLLVSYIIAIATAALTTITFIIAFLTPPLSGPGCIADCFEYPFTDIAGRFPRDYYWMYPAMLVMLLYIFLMATIHEYAEEGKKLFSRIGFALSILSAGIIIPDYYMQVTVIQPSLLNGETDGIPLLTQFNPHGVFIALEEAGFILMCLSFICIIPVFNGRGVLKAIRITFLAGFILAVFSFVVIALKYGIRREYIFEITIISIVWFELIISSVLLSILFSRLMKK